jgi:hypothetical protein
MSRARDACDLGQAIGGLLNVGWPDFACEQVEVAGHALGDGGRVVAAE